MKEELDQFEKNYVWKLVKLSQGKHVVKAKWFYRNKLDEDGKVIRNKAQVVAKGYSQ